MLIEVEHGVFVQTNQIETIEAVPSGDNKMPRTRVVFASGKSRVFESFADRFAPHIGSVVPAPPGYSLITSQAGDATDPDPYHHTLPVVAFRIDGMSGGPLNPITDEGEPSEMSSWALVRPDGTVVNWDRSFATVEQYKADLDATARRIAA